MPNKDFLSQLRTNNEVFSAFRVHKTQSDLAALMVSENGQLKSFSQFAKDAQPYLNHQNKRWLRTEYDTAVQRAHQAADWQQFEADKDVLPNLEWMPTTSITPGADHQIFWGTIRPVDDPFWSQHRPGDRWGCKCSLEPTDKDATPLKNVQTEIDFPSDGLDNNPGKDGKIFNQTHPYFASNCTVCPFASNGSKLLALAGLQKKDCYNCKSVKAQINKADIAKNKLEFNGFNSSYEKTLFDSEKGGYVVTSKERIAFAKRNKQELAKFKKEQGMCKVFAANGFRMVHLSEVSGVPSPDTLCNGVLADLKKTKSASNIVKYATDAINKQGAKLVLFEFEQETKKIHEALLKLKRQNVKGYYYFSSNKSQIYFI